MQIFLDHLPKFFSVPKKYSFSDRSLKNEHKHSSHPTHKKKLHTNSTYISNYNFSHWTFSECHWKQNVNKSRRKLPTTWLGERLALTGYWGYSTRNPMRGCLSNSSRWKGGGDVFWSVTNRSNKINVPLLNSGVNCSTLWIIPVVNAMTPAGCSAFPLKYHYQDFRQKQLRGFA